MMSIYKIGTKVKIIKNNANSLNKIGDIGIIKGIRKLSDTTKFVFKVVAPNTVDASRCWSYEKDLQIVDYKENIIQW
jgi:ATP-dependent exoDNAse (exonuclease V) alpha subunit